MSDDEYRIGNVSGTGFAIGRGAVGQQFNAPTPQQQELKELLAELRRELEAHSGELEDADALSGSADLVERELESDKPNVGAVRTLLSGMVAGAGEVASLVEVLLRLQRAAAAIF
jgi:hypothetical protein